MNADSPSEIAWLTRELARVQKRAAELSAMLADKLRKLTEESAVLPEQTARATRSHTGSFIDTWIPSAAPVAADATTTLALGKVGSFLYRDGPAAVLPDATATLVPCRQCPLTAPRIVRARRWWNCRVRSVQHSWRSS